MAMQMLTYLVTDWGKVDVSSVVMDGGAFMPDRVKEAMAKYAGARLKDGLDPIEGLRGVMCDAYVRDQQTGL